MSWQDLIIRTLAVCLVLTGSLSAYTWVLVQIGRSFGKTGRLLFGTMVYLLQAALIVGSLIFLLLSGSEASSPHITGTSLVVTVFVSWLCALVPGFLYLRSQMPLLRRYGFFLPRSRS